MMIKIKRVFISSLFFVCFFVVNNVYTQEINQFNKNKKRTGVWKKYYLNKRIRYEGQFKNGKEIGLFKFYDIRSSKFPSATKEFSVTSNLVKVTFYNLKGKITSKGNMIGKNRVGKWLYYFDDGKLFSEENYKDGKLEGAVKNYYKNGKLTEITHYKNGLLEGVSKIYSDKGILLEEVHYKKGKLNGEAKYFELNGNLRESGSYENDKRIGEWEFYINGQKATEKEKKKQNQYKKQKS